MSAHGISPGPDSPAATPPPEPTRGLGPVGPPPGGPVSRPPSGPPPGGPPSRLSIQGGNVVPRTPALAPTREEAQTTAGPGPLSDAPPSRASPRWRPAAPWPPPPSGSGPTHMAPPLTGSGPMPMAPPLTGPGAMPTPPPLTGSGAVPTPPPLTGSGAVPTQLSGPAPTTDTVSELAEALIAATQTGNLAAAKALFTALKQVSSTYLSELAEALIAATQTGNLAAANALSKALEQALKQDPATYVIVDRIIVDRGAAAATARDWALADTWEPSPRITVTREPHQDGLATTRATPAGPAPPYSGGLAALRATEGMFPTGSSSELSKTQSAMHISLYKTCKELDPSLPPLSECRANEMWNYLCKAWMPMGGDSAAAKGITAAAAPMIKKIPEFMTWNLDKAPSSIDEICKEFTALMRDFKNLPTSGYVLPSKTGIYVMERLATNYPLLFRFRTKLPSFFSADGTEQDITRIEQKELMLLIILGAYVRLADPVSYTSAGQALKTTLQQLRLPPTVTRQPTRSLTLAALTQLTDVVKDLQTKYPDLAPARYWYDLLFGPTLADEQVFIEKGLRTFLAKGMEQVATSELGRNKDWLRDHMNDTQSAIERLFTYDIKMVLAADQFLGSSSSSFTTTAEAKARRTTVDNAASRTAATASSAGTRETKTCYNCNKTGHFSNTCTEPCKYCKETSHKSNTCPNRGGGDDSGSTRSGRTARSGRSDSSARSRRTSSAPPRTKPLYKDPKIAEWPCPISGHEKKHVTGECSERCPLHGGHMVRECRKGGRDNTPAGFLPARFAPEQPRTARVARVVLGQRDDTELKVFKNYEEPPDGWTKPGRAKVIDPATTDIIVSLGGVGTTPQGDPTRHCNALIDSGAQMSFMNEDMLDHLGPCEKVIELAERIKVTGAFNFEGTKVVEFFATATFSSGNVDELKGTGVPPRVTDLGGILTCVVVPSEVWREHASASGHGYDAILGVDTRGTWISRLIVDATAAQHGLGPPVYIHNATTVTIRRTTEGTNRSAAEVFGPVPFDTIPPEDSDLFGEGEKALLMPAYAESRSPFIEELRVDPLEERLRQHLEHEEKTIELTITPSKREQLWAEFGPRVGELGQQPHVKEKLLDLLEEYVDLFMPPTAGGEEIRFEVRPGATKTTEGLHRTFTPAQNLACWEIVMDYLKRGLVEKRATKDGLAINGIVMVKQALKYRFCMDMRPLNKDLVRETTTVLPDIDEHLRALAECIFFSTTDETLAFLQCIVAEECRDWLGFCVRNPTTNEMEYYRWVGTPFGPAFMPGRFQARQEHNIEPMHAHLTAILRVFMDNWDLGQLKSGPIDKMVDEHLAALKTMFACIRKKGAVLSASKTYFFQNKINTLGATVSNKHIGIDKSRLSAWNLFKQEPSLPTIKHLQGIVGALNYAAPHAGPQFNELISPLYDTLKTAVAAERAAGDDMPRVREARNLKHVWRGIQPRIDKLVDLVMESKGLALLDPNKPAFIKGDASDGGAGYMIYQYDDNGDVVINYAGRLSFNTNQRSYSIGGRELLALLLVARAKYRLLAGMRNAIILVSDHFNILTMDFLEQAHVKRWVAELKTLLPTISDRIHVYGQANTLCDMWSRMQDENDPHTLTEIDDAGIKALSTSVRRVTFQPSAHPHESSLSELGKAILDAQSSMPESERKDYMDLGATAKTIDGQQVLFLKGRIIAPHKEDLLNQLWNLVHDKSLHAHAGAGITMLGRGRIYVHDGPSRLREYTASCPECQLTLAPGEPRPHAAPLLLPPRYPAFHHVLMDHFTLPQEASGDPNGFILVVDSNTRIATATVTNGSKASDAVAALKDFINHFSLPRLVSADGGPTFRGDFAIFCEKHGIERLDATPYNPKGRGIVERLGGVIKHALSRMLPDHAKAKWASHLPEVMNTLRTMPHAGLGGLSPEQVAFATSPTPRITAFANVPITDRNRGELIDACMALRSITTVCSEVQSLTTKARHDALLSDETFRVGDTVAVYNPHRETSLHSFWNAPHVITRDLGNGFYTHAELLPGNVHGTESNAHAGRIIPFSMDRTDATLEMQKKLPPGYHTVETILEGPRDTDGRFLVKWALLPNPTWEPAEALRGVNQYQAYCAEHNLAPKTGQPLPQRGARKRGKRGT